MCEREREREREKERERGVTKDMIANDTEQSIRW